jgi:hypothetical protein
MANHKSKSWCPQAKHKKSKPSQHDKRGRLDCPNPKRKKTTKAKVSLVGSMLNHVRSMADQLDARMAFRLAIIVSGVMLADDRRVAAAWFTSGGVLDDWDRFYDCLTSIGSRVAVVAKPLAIAVARRFDPGPSGHLVLAVDDTPTKRYGHKVEGAGVHHNPTAGPAEGEWLYGHNWVSLSLLCRHTLWGIIALPLLSRLYVRAKDVPALDDKYGWKFQTKHQLLVALVTWFLGILRDLEMTCQVWLVADGAYAARPVLTPMLKQGVVVFSRLRKDAALFDLAPKVKDKQRGRPRVYGRNRIDLSKRAASPRGWKTITYHCRGSEVTRQYKTFLATTKLTGGVIRVVIVRFEDKGWAAYFCTEPEVEVKDILETVAARWAIEEHFHDVKEVWGAGQQQVRNVWSNIACWHLNQWMYTMVEMATWDVPQAKLTDRSTRPWDNPGRRPSHADKRRSISRKMLRERFLTCLPERPDLRKIKRSIAELISLSI